MECFSFTRGADLRLIHYRTSFFIDFLALDASVAIRLDVNDATSTTSDGVTTLSWRVCDRPWSVGDKLMLQISSSPPELAGVTNDGTCDAPAPEPTPTVTAAQ